MKIFNLMVLKVKVHYHEQNYEILYHKPLYSHLINNIICLITDFFEKLVNYLIIYYI